MHGQSDEPGLAAGISYSELDADGNKLGENPDGAGTGKGGMRGRGRNGSGGGGSHLVDYL